MLKKPFLKGRTLRKKVNTLRQRNCHLKKVVSEQRKMILEGKKAMEKLLKVSNNSLDVLTGQECLEIQFDLQFCFDKLEKCFIRA